MIFKPVPDTALYGSSRDTVSDTAVWCPHRWDLRPHRDGAITDIRRDGRGELRARGVPDAGNVQFVLCLADPRVGSVRLHPFDNACVLRLRRDQ